MSSADNSRRSGSTTPARSTTPRTAYRGESKHRQRSSRVLAEGSRRILIGRLGELGGFLRYENFDTQECRPAMCLSSNSTATRVFGANFWPDPDVAVKVDYTVVRNQSSVISAPNSFNMGLGWWF